jgi:hypothetical protein
MEFDHDLIADAVEAEVDYWVSMLSIEASAALIEEAPRVTSLGIKELGRVLREGISADERAKMNEQLMARARAAMMRVYTRQRNKERSVRGYRSGLEGKYKRYANGKLTAAITSPNFFSADANGIHMNMGFLSREARQWARLNFGAGEKGRGGAGKKTVYIGHMAVAALGFDDGARPAMKMPLGYFADAGGKLVGKGAKPYQYIPMATIPKSKTGKAGYRMAVNPETGKRTKIKGIKPVGSYEGERFLDAAIASLTNKQTGIGPAYEKLYRDLWNKGKTRTAQQGAARPYRREITVR